MLATLYKEFKSSIKSPDTEEKLDLFFYRPCGYIIAKVSRLFFLTPSIVSILGLIAGLLSSYFYLDVGNKTSMVWASGLFILSGVFDSADGQLARLYNLSSKLGLILDGICDSLVIIAIYGTCSLPFIRENGSWFILLVLLALHLHSCQCAILDFYHREYLFFGYGKTSDATYWNPNVSEAKAIIKESESGVEKIMNFLRLTWIKKQQQFTTRTEEERLKLRTLLLNSNESKKQKVMDIYKKHNLWLLPFWRLVGVNAHTALLIVFMFANRFDLYLVLFDLILLNLIVAFVSILQKQSDKKMFKALEQL